MKISEIYPSKYITAADLQGRTITLTITNVTMEEMLTHDNKKATKPVAWFERTTKGFVMNLTNAKIVANLYGDETDGWTGKRISVYPTRVKAFGAMTDCIRVREEIPAQPKPPTQAAQVEEPSGLDDDEDVADYEEQGGTEREVDARTGEILLPANYFVNAPDTENPENIESVIDVNPFDDAEEAHASPPHSRLWGQGMSVFGPDWDMARGWLLSKWTALVTPDNTRNSASELNDDEKDTLADYLKDNASKLQKIWPTQKAIIVQRTADAKSAA